VGERRFTEELSYYDCLAGGDNFFATYQAKLELLCITNSVFRFSLPGASASPNYLMEILNAIVDIVL